LQEFALKKKRNTGCTGMFWRKDPTGKTKLGFFASNNHWSRDGATLRGTVVHAKGEKWLLATHVKQAGGNWERAPAGAAMVSDFNATEGTLCKSVDKVI
jgi:hypothetical protein